MQHITQASDFQILLRPLGRTRATKSFCPFYSVNIQSMHPILYFSKDVLHSMLGEKSKRKA